MTLASVYADFNALLIAQPRPDTPEVEMPITGYGTLMTLAQQGIRLEEGMPLLLYEPNDIQCVAHAHFDAQMTDPAGRAGSWVAVLDPAQVQDCALPELAHLHPCLACGTDLWAFLQALPKRYAEHCPVCDVSVMAPMAPPWE